MERRPQESEPTAPETPFEAQEVSPSTEEQIDKEMQSPQWQTKIILQRHGRYDNRFPEAGWANPTEEEKASLGRLTEEGAVEARDIARERIETALAQGGKDVDFLVVASPTLWLDHPDFGQRAIETAEIISDEITQQLTEAGLPEDQLLNTTSSFKSFDDKAVRASKKLVESQMFLDLEFTDEMRKKYGGQGREFWDAYNEDADRERRKEVGAEGSPEAADRVNRQMNTLARWAKARKIEHPHRKTVIFVVSHHEAIEPYAQRVIGTQPGEFEPQYNDGIEIEIDSEGVAKTEIAGRIIDVAFAAHGMPKSVDKEDDQK